MIDETTNFYIHKINGKAYFIKYKDRNYSGLVIYQIKSLFYFNNVKENLYIEKYNFFIISNQRLKSKY